jgi:hypothetical protein
MSIKKTVVAAMAAMVFSAGCEQNVREDRAWLPYLQVVRSDAAHNRLWVLEREALSVHDNTNGRRLRRIVLPDWILMRPEYGCAPDLVVDAKGVAYVSSNVQPVLWRIDPASYAVTRIELALDSDADKDVGFANLQFTADGALLSAGATFSSLWRIDLVAGRASKLAGYAGLQRSCDTAALVRSGAQAGISVIAASRR